MTPLVLIPAHNEEKSIAGVLGGLRRLYPYAQLVVVDNGSTDSTAAIANHYGSTVLYEPRKGYSNALKAGYAYALEQDFSALIQLDADGQHPYWLVPRLLSALLRSDADWIVGSREGTGSPGGFGRRAGAFFMVAVAKRKGLQLCDLSSGFWALRPNAVSVILDSIDSECVDANLRVLAKRSGLNIREVSTPMSDRYAGESMHHGWRGVTHGLMSAWKLLRC